MSDPQDRAGADDDARGIPTEPSPADPRSAPDPAADAARSQPSASDLFGQALGGAARRAGMDPAREAHTGHVVWRAMGGWLSLIHI